MNNEIKEILDYLDYGVNSLSISKPPFKIEYEDIKKLLDYITNLQQKCKKQKEVIDRIDKYIKPLITNRDDEQYYDINWYNKDVLLSMLKEVSE